MVAEYLDTLVILALGFLAILVFQVQMVKVDIQAQVEFLDLAEAV